MKLAVYTNMEWEDEVALIDLETMKVIYQDDEIEIRGKIEGYLKALKDHGVYTEEPLSVGINIEHEHFKLLNFYDGY